MTLDKIFKAFPPPKFLDTPFAGLAISDSAIRSIQFERKNDTLFIKKYGEKVIPFGIITSGQINNKEELTKLLQIFKKEFNLNYVKVSLPEEKAYLFTTKIPVVKKDEVRSAIESKIEENVPVPPGELIFDYRLIDHNTKDHLDVVVSAIPISIVDMYVEILDGADLSPLSLEIESQAIASALLSPKISSTILIVHFGTEKLGLYVVTDGVVHFTSAILTKGDSLNNPDFLSQEIKKLYVYWHSLKENLDNPERKISEIVVCGKNFSDSVIPYLSVHNQTKVSLGNVWTNAFDVNVTVPEITHTDSLKYATAVGLALPSEILI